MDAFRVIDHATGKDKLVRSDDVYRRLASYFSRIGSTIILLGDSHETYSAPEDSSTPSGVRFSSNGYLTYANAELSLYFKRIVAGGVGGETLSQIRARLPGIIAANPDASCILIGGGTNGSASAEEDFDEIKIMCDYSSRKGLTVICRTIPPRGTTAASYQAKYNKTNNLIRDLCRLKGYLLFDINRVLMNPSTNAFFVAGETDIFGNVVKADYAAADQTHLSATAGVVAGKELCRTVAPFLDFDIEPIGVNTWPGRPNKLGEIGMLLGSTSSGTSGLSAGSVMPNGWAKTGSPVIPAGSGGSLTTSKVASTKPNIPGDMLQIKAVEGASQTGGSVNIIATLTPLFSIGERISGSLYYEWDDSGFGGSQGVETLLSAWIDCSDAAFAVIKRFAWMPGVTPDVRGMAFSSGIIALPDTDKFNTPLVVPPNTANIFFYLAFKGLGTVRVANVIVG